MKRMRVDSAQIKLGSRFQPALNVVEYISTKKGDAERGPMVRMNGSEARFRLLRDGELVWVQGPQGHVALRDVAGVTVSESVTVSKPDLDTPAGKRHFG
jgi:hypothetical protein